jgi:hypothetical protein
VTLPTRRTALYRLMKAESGPFVPASSDEVTRRIKDLPRAGEPLLEVGLGHASAFFRIELALAGELEFAGVVEEDAFFLDVGEEVVAAG